MFAVALKVDAFFDARMPIDEMAAPGPLLETKTSEKVAKIVERYRRIRIAPQNSSEKQSRPRHRNIVPTWLEATFGLTFRLSGERSESA